MDRIPSEREPVVANADAHDEKGRFKPGHRVYSRRERGDKITRDLKQSVLEGAARVGSDGKGKDGLLGYCTMLATKFPKNYTYLLGKVLPLDARANGQINIGPVSVRVTPVSSGRYLSADDMMRLVPTVIDNEPLQPEDEQDGVERPPWDKTH